MSTARRSSRCASRPILRRWPPGRSASTSLSTRLPASNVNVATGTLNGPTRQSVIHANGQLMNAAEFAPQVVTYRDGAPVRFQDVARVIDSVENNRTANWFRGQRAIGTFDPAPARFKHHRAGRCDQQGAAAPSCSSFRRRCIWRSIYDRSQTIRDLDLGRADDPADRRFAGGRASSSSSCGAFRQRSFRPSHCRSQSSEPSQACRCSVTISTISR